MALKKTGDWNLNLRGDKQAYYATIFRAAHHYYYKYIRGLRRPPQNSFWRTQMKIRAFLENVSDDGALGTHKEERRFLGAQIKMYTYQREAESTYSTVIHELAHASHWNMNRNKYDDSGSKIKESWAAGVEWSLTRLIYPNYSRGYNATYTGVVVDMIDPIGGIDQVTGYTIRQIEDALNGKTTWSSWRDNIINTIENDTEENLAPLFDRWDF